MVPGPDAMHSTSTTKTSTNIDAYRNHHLTGRRTTKTSQATDPTA